MTSAIFNDIVDLQIVLSLTGGGTTQHVQRVNQTLYFYHFGYFGIFYEQGDVETFFFKLLLLWILCYQLKIILARKNEIIVKKMCLM